MGKIYKAMESQCQFSVVIPVFNEAQSIPFLVDRLLLVLESLGTHEVIFINDGSTDGTDTVLDEIKEKHPNTIKIIHFRTNCGKSVALQHGFNMACGELVFMLDGDLQDQPEEMPKLLKAMEEQKLDAITGWKLHRQDPVTKTFPSRGFNWMMNRLSGLDIHDFNCGLKLFKSKCLEHIVLYGQMHRFILLFVANYGFRVGEVAVEHSPREFGESKYGAGRIYYGFMDILTAFFITRYLESPLYFFGFYGLIAILVSIFIGVFYIGMHFLSFFVHIPNGSLADHPLWIVSPILFLIGVMMIFFGLLGEMLTFHAMNSNSNRSPVARRDKFYE